MNVGRNEPCPCGSGKKYKRCCLLRDDNAKIEDYLWHKMRRTEVELAQTLMEYAHTRYGEDAIYEAWDEFTLWEEVPFDAEEYPELEATFLPWYFFNWIPDNAGRDPSEPDLPETQIAITYMKENPDNLDEFKKRFIRTICKQPYSFYAVTDVVPGQSLTIKDILLSRVYTVREREASQTELKGHILFSRVLSIDDTSIMVGCAPKVIPPNYHYFFIDLQEDLTEQFKKLTPDILHEIDIEIRELYFEIQESLENNEMPELVNTDGDPLTFITLHYDLKCSQQETFNKLKNLSYTIEEEELLANAVYDKDGTLQKVSFKWLEKGNKLHKNWENTVMGEINIIGNSLTIEVNSVKRAENIQKKIKRLLKDHAVYKDSLVQSLEKALEQGMNQPETAKEQKIREEHERLNETPEAQAMLKEMAEKHWESWLDQDIPALGNQTPRQAAKSPVGRKKLDALFLEYESHSSAQSQRELLPDIPKLRRILGLND